MSDVTPGIPRTDEITDEDWGRHQRFLRERPQPVQVCLAPHPDNPAQIVEHDVVGGAYYVGGDLHDVRCTRCGGVWTVARIA